MTPASRGVFVYDIPRSDAVSRDTRSCHFALRRGIQKYRQRLVPASDTLLDPALSAGYVHSSQQREERTKKRRRCYRALSVVGWRRPRGLRNSLRSDSPRPRSSVGWPLPGPIKAESIATMQRLGHTARGGESMSYRAPGIPVHVLPRCDAESRNTGIGWYPQATLYWTPHRVRGDTVCIGSREACRSISCCDAVARLCAGPWAAKMSTPGIGQDGADGENTA